MLKMMNEESWEWLREYIISEKVILVLFIVVMSGLWLRVILSIMKGMVLIHRSKHDSASRLYRFEMITEIIVTVSGAAGVLLFMFVFFRDI